MSREIKYRVWDNENNSYDDPYSYSYYAMKQDGGLDFYCHGDLYDSCDPNIYIVEQYTGLKDKNGESIYVGDIVKWKDGKGSVFYEEELARYSVYSKHGGISPLVGKKTKRHLMYEVIGNIHKEEK